MAFRKKAAAAPPQSERMLAVLAAAEKQGTFTSSDIAAACDLTVAQASHALCVWGDSWGRVERVSKDGTIVTWRFVYGERH